LKGGDKDGHRNVADSTALVDETRAVEIAGDTLRLYELARKPNGSPGPRGEIIMGARMG
jgi:hypothetical protein